MLMKLIITIVLLICMLGNTGATGEPEGNEKNGQWYVIKIEVCENPDSYNIIYQPERHRVNRTHDIFEAEVSCDRNITVNNTGVRMDVQKKMADSGFKDFQSFKYDSFCKFINEHAQENFQRGLMSIGLEPDCPIPKGNYSVPKFMVNYLELPDGIVGMFKLIAYLTQNGKDISCIVVYAEYKEVDNDD